MMESSESFRRFQIMAFVTVILVAFVSLMVLAGMCIAQPPGPEDPCLEKLIPLGEGSYTRECPHSDHTMEKTADGYRCMCVSREQGET